MAKVLVVDDDVALRELLKEVIGGLGHDVMMARDGMEAISKIREQRFDLVVLDVNMPLVSGREVLKIIRSSSDCDQTAVLMCTAQHMAGQVDAAFHAGAAGYIIKPFDLPNVIAIVTKTLAAQPAR